MTEKGFLEYVTTVRWRFAKSVPNWPHFYIVEEELEDQLGYAATRAFIREQCLDEELKQLQSLLPAAHDLSLLLSGR